MAGRRCPQSLYVTCDEITKQRSKQDKQFCEHRILFQMNLVHTLISHFYKIHFNIITFRCLCHSKEIIQARCRMYNSINPLPRGPPLVRSPRLFIQLVCSNCNLRARYCVVTRNPRHTAKSCIIIYKFV
jgi:hypothetical protein